MRGSLLGYAGPLLLCLTLTGCGSETATDDPQPGADSPGSSEGSAACAYPQGGEPARPVDPPPESPGERDEVPVTFSTSIGDLTATLNATSAPCTVNSLISLVEQGWYDDTECHRLTTQGIYVLQCGDPTGTGRGGPGYTIPDELDEDDTFPAGTLAMANTGQPDSGGSQFFIVYEDTDLPPSYTVFGTLDEASTQAVRDLAADGVRGGGPDGPPATEVRITAVTTG